MTSPAVTTRFIDANGLRFEVNECGEGDHLALCLHGFPESAFSWRYQLPFLARLGYRAWAPNLRGYGRSSRPGRVEDYRINHLVTDVEALIDAAGPGRTLLIGHDWGGIVAWMTATGKRRELDGLVIMNAPHPARFVQQLFTWRQIRRSWYAFAFQIPRLPEFFLGRREAQGIATIFRNMAVDKSRFPRDVLDVYRRQALEPGALTAMVNYYRANLGLGWRRQAEQADPIDVPTLLVWGEADTALSKELTFGTEQLVRHLTIRYLPDVSHWVQQEAPEQVNGILESWLAQHRTTDRMLT